MPTFAEITAHADRLFPFQHADSYDAVGPVLGTPGADITRVVYALDLTAPAVEEAVAKGCQLIIVHHPPLFDAVRTLTGPAAWPVCLAARCGLCVLALHTNLDADMYSGTAAALARALGVTIIRPLLPLPQGSNDPMLGEGALCESSLTAAQLLAAVAALNPAAVHSPLPGEIRRIALWPGGGVNDERLSAAKAAGCDAFLCGEVKHNLWGMAQSMGLPLIVCGHYETEWPGMRSLAAALKLHKKGVEEEIFFHAPPAAIVRG